MCETGREGKVALLLPFYPGRFCQLRTDGQLDGIEFNATDKGIVCTSLRESDDDLAVAIGCDRELLLQGCLVIRFASCIVHIPFQAFSIYSVS